MTDSILIVGTGALATLFAYRFSAVGFNVTVLGTWQAGLLALGKEGARLDGRAGRPVRAITDPGGFEGVKYALVLVKSWQTERAAHQLAKCLAQDGLATTLQNGLGNDEVLIKRLGKSRVGRGITTIGATLIGPGYVHLGGEGMVVLEKGPQTSRLEELLRQAHFQVEAVENIEAQVWGKLILNAAINPLTALLRIKNGRLLEIPSAKTMMKEIAREAVLVAQAEGIALPFSNAGEALEEVARRSGDNVSSMLQDVLRGAPTEVDSINGKIVQAGEKHHLPTPLNRLMTLMVKALSERGKINALDIG